MTIDLAAQPFRSFGDCFRAGFVRCFAAGSYLWPPFCHLLAALSRRWNQESRFPTNWAAKLRIVGTKNCWREYLRLI